MKRKVFSESLSAQYASIAAAVPKARGAEGANSAGKPVTGKSFDQVLRENVKQKEALIFSKHAEIRMSQREIELSGDDLGKLLEAVEKAGQKGVRNTLVFMDQMAFVVNVPSSVVITAMKGKDLEENVFTQIDGAVIA